MGRDVSRPAWLEIDLDAIEHNMNEIIRHVGEGVEVMPVVKADAYGHGCVEIAKTYRNMGIKQVAVATLSEAIMLRYGMGEVPIKILVLGYTPPYLIESSLNYDVAMTVYTYEQAKRISDIALSMGRKAVLHVKIETGLNRLGFDPVKENIAEILKIKDLPGVEAEGVFTHFAAADEDEAYTCRQARLFEQMVEWLQEEGMTFRYIHASNSAATIAYPKFHYNMVRPGLINYGIYPNNSPEERAIINLIPVLAVKAEIVHLKTLAPGDKVSYGLTFEATREMELATIPIGYADGYNRALGNKSNVLVHGKRRPIVGKICMDHLMADVSGIEVNIGDVVTLVGKEGKEEINLYNVSALLPGQIPHSLMSMFTKRLPRVYTKDKKEILCRDYILDLAHQFQCEPYKEV
ncbi:MAG: alanine racemase [Tissierellia bacterium]|nr:alanine racemase [Tissierellia bacterium]